MKECVNRFSNLKDHQNVRETNGTMLTSDNQNQKSRIAVKKASSSSSKGEWRTYSADFLLIS